MKNYTIKLNMGTLSHEKVKTLAAKIEALLPQRYSELLERNVSEFTVQIVEDTPPTPKFIEITAYRSKNRFDPQEGPTWIPYQAWINVDSILYLIGNYILDYLT